MDALSKMGTGGGDIDKAMQIDKEQASNKCVQLVDHSNTMDILGDKSKFGCQVSTNN
jgi:hypothetical protein